MNTSEPNSRGDDEQRAKDFFQASPEKTPPTSGLREGEPASPSRLALRARRHGSRRTPDRAPRRTLRRRDTREGRRRPRVHNANPRATRPRRRPRPRNRGESTRGPDREDPRADRRNRAKPSDAFSPSQRTGSRSSRSTTPKRKPAGRSGSLRARLLARDAGSLATVAIVTSNPGSSRSRKRLAFASPTSKEDTRSEPGSCRRRECSRLTS